MPTPNRYRTPLTVASALLLTVTVCPRSVGAQAGWQSATRPVRTCAAADSLYGPIDDRERLTEERDRLSDSVAVVAGQHSRPALSFRTNYRIEFRAERLGAGPYSAPIMWAVIAQQPDVLQATSVRILADTLSISAPVRRTVQRDAPLGLAAWHLAAAELTPAQFIAITRAERVSWRVADVSATMPASALIAARALGRELVCGPFAERAAP